MKKLLLVSLKIKWFHKGGGICPFEKEVRKIDINTAAESEIAAIPAIGIILAKKVVKKRQDLGGSNHLSSFQKLWN
ncbi:helix-hairpin-helix domain-containing protein [Bacillus thuringiensis]|uniref:helix-hairpin-helix domain-containing protein n=1 Tax=Bacillus thuringiensis TaxID=1428 RepID=UPI0018C888C9